MPQKPAPDFSHASPSNMPAPESAPGSVHGIVSALAAFAIWGFVPIYFKQIAHVPALEIIAHRIVWSLVLIFLIVFIGRKMRTFLAVFRDRRKWSLLLLTAALVSVNWLVFIWAVNDGRILESSLGYYINPLVNVLLGMLFLSERLNRWQSLAVALAVIAVLILTLMVGSLPWVSLVLAFSFGVYGLLRKMVQVDSSVGLAVETGYLTPVAIAYLLWLSWTGAGASAPTGHGFFMTGDWKTDMFLMGTGIATGVPLLLFTIGARNLRLTTLGVLQYLAPTLQFFLAVFFYQETFTRGHVVAFTLIWIGLLIYSWDGYRRRERRT